MKHLPQHTAILIFSRTAQEEARAKQFGRHLTAAQNLQIAQLLIRRTRRMARRTGLPVFTVTGAQQHGHTFGQRFTNAIAAIFAKGFERVITIGTDCPALQPQLLLDAAHQLKAGKIVTGADHQGGIYFLGLSRQHFFQASLSELPWQSGQDFMGLHQYAQALGVELAAGSVLYDVDDARDLQLVFRNWQPACSLLKKLRQLLQNHSSSIPKAVWFREIHFPLTNGLRGPPSTPSYRKVFPIIKFTDQIQPQKL